MARVLLLLSSTLCCLALVFLPSPGAAQGADGVVYAAAPEERGAYRVGAQGGQAGHFGYNTGDGIARVEVRREDGSVVGSYRYYDPYGKQVVRSYIADDQGFRVLGNDLPISLDTPAYKVEGAPALTGAVEGTQDFAQPPQLQPGSARTVQPGTLQQSIHNNPLTPLTRSDDQLVQLLASPAGGLQAQVLRQQQAVQAQQLQQMQELQAGLIAQQQLNIKKQAQTIAQQQARYGGPVNNELTGGLTSPYYEYPRDLPFDFPAGFAYPGEPVARQPEADPVSTPRPYIIGKRDPIQTPEPTTSTTTTTTTTTTLPPPPPPPLVGDDPAHPEVNIIPGRSPSELSTHAPVAPSKGGDPDHPMVDITAGHTHNEVSTHPPAAPHKVIRPVDDTITAGHTHVSDNTIPSRRGSHNIVSQSDLIVSPELPRPTALHNPDQRHPASNRPLWNYNDYSTFNSRDHYNAVQRPIIRRDRNRISQQPLWNYNKNPYIRRQSYERIRPISGRPKLPHCPGWCPE